MSGESNGRLLLSAVQVAAALSVSRATVWRLDAAGKLPRPVRLGGSTRWKADELASWTAVGCPDRRTWEATKGNGRLEKDGR